MAGITNWVGSLQQRLDTWARQQRDRVTAAAPPLPQMLTWRRWQWNWKWPWLDARERKKKLQEEYTRRREQIQALCRAVKAENVTDLRDILSAMILSECVYKRPESELVRAVNKFKADFGEQLVPLERVQASLDHVQHRYLLAEAGDTLFASFIGTKQYKDVMADANILQGALFHEDYDSSHLQDEDNPEIVMSSEQACPSYGKGQPGLTTDSSTKKAKERRLRPKPAAHRGFLARAKGIPAVELYRLAQKKDRKLVLCGHSLGGAVAVLATLAILRVFASSSTSRNEERVQVKCITFSQPPVGNAALRDYVHKRGWHRHFRTYCIPEDIVPRILSPAYFQHYRTQAPGPVNDSTISHTELTGQTAGSRSGTKAGEGERLVLGLGPLQSSLWRITRLVPLVGTRTPSFRLKNKKTNSEDLTSSAGNSLDENGKGEAIPESLEIQEGAEAITLTSLPISTDIQKPSAENGKAASTGGGSWNGVAVDWRSRVPSFPSYVPFGKLFLLEKSSVEPLSALEYTQLTSVQSVLTELRERFQSHTMRSYRARFQKMYDLCMCDGNPPLFTMEHLPHLPHFQQWLGFPGPVVTETGRIAEPLIVRSATSIVPLGWSGLLGGKKGCEPLRIDILGNGLHLCTLVKAQVNGQWCSTTVESLPPPPPLYSKELQNETPPLQKMRIRVGPPLQESPSQGLIGGMVASTSAAANSMPGTERIVANLTMNGDNENGILGAGTCHIEGLSEVLLHCSSDFVTASKEVLLRLRRVRLLGLEGAGKTSLFYALLGQGRGTTFSNSDGVLTNMEWQEGVAEGVAYIDPAGVNLQDLAGDAKQLKHELSSVGDQLSKKVDLVILVHNLSHKIPRLHQSSSHAQARSALSLLIDEVTAAGIPHVLAITNKFSVSADRRQVAASAVMETYNMPSNLSVVINSCPYTVHGIGGGSTGVQRSATLDMPEVKVANLNGRVQGAAQRLISAPINLVQLPFRKKEVILPVEGVKNLHTLVHKVLLNQEEAALEELSREQLAFTTRNELSHIAKQALRHDHAISADAAAAAVGAGFGLVIAVLTVAASSFRKP